MSLFGPDRRRVIRPSAEVHRIAALPRRTWSEKDLTDLVREMTARLKTPSGTQTLRPDQAVALYEIRQMNGGVCQLGCGKGKTLITLLAPMVLTHIPAVPLLLLPASLIHKTEVERAEYAKHWRIATHQRFQSYDMLSRVEQASFLETYKPDYIGGDEIHKLKNPKAGCTKRVLRYFSQHPTTIACVLSGTLSKKSLHNMAHIVAWAMKGNSPLPLTDAEIAEWADALDEDVNPLQRIHPGAILSFGGFDTDADEVTQGRQAFRARFLSTPGIISSGTTEDVSASLNVQSVRYPEASITNGHFTKLRGTWTTPDGWAFATALTAWRHARELALGYHSIWDPRPPDAWINARREWAAECRDILSRSQHLDTELQVKQAVWEGQVRCPQLQTWTDIEPSFIPNPKDVWHDTSALDFCEAWMRKKNGLVWCDHVFFARELSRRSGVPYFGEGGLTKDGQNILTLEKSKDAGKIPLILSVRANSTGRNLQAWNENLITSLRGSGSDNEQLISRTYRTGQDHGEVNVEIMLGCWETWYAYQKTLAQSYASKDTFGEEYRLLSATKDFPDEAELKTYVGDRWAKMSVKPTDGTAAAIWGDDDDDEE